MNTKILETKNEEWGFWGTTATNYQTNETKKRWSEAFETLMQLSGKPAEDIREFLDSRHGRHLADDCYNADVKETILKNYYKHYDDTLFDDKTNFKAIEKDRTMFGINVLNTITKTEDVLLYTFKKPNRIYDNYAACIDINEKIYFIGLEHLTSV